MVRYEVFKEDFDASLSYLELIYSWSRKMHSSPKLKDPVLVGGWAVDAYNSWYGSLDIDFITNSRTRNSLRQFLRNEYGFSTEEIVPKQKTVSKETKSGRRIEIDFVGNEMGFEGKNGCIIKSSDYIC